MRRKDHGPKKQDTSPIYQLKITLKDSKPPIWRRVQVRGSLSLYRLHDVIQIAMGWTDSHLHRFIVGKDFYGVPSPDWDFEVKDERRAHLGDIVAKENDRFVYEYDFGDSWQHDIVVEKVLPPDPAAKLPVCLEGKRAGPVEDVGGIWGYQEFLEALADPNHPEHQEYSEWIDVDEFDPEAFDLEATNKALKLV